MTLQEFWEELNKHDWYYNYSDDQRVWRKGEQETKRLQGIAQSGGAQYIELMSAFSQHCFSGESFGTEKVPKPEKPV